MPGRARSSCTSSGAMLAEIAGHGRGVAAARGRRPGRAGRRADDPRLPPVRGASSATKVLIPDSAHGTNPASTRARPASRWSSVKSERRRRRGPRPTSSGTSTTDVAAFMITKPNTLGLFEPQHRRDRARWCHDAGGAGLHGRRQPQRASSGIARPGDLGFDVMHFNLHKTFTTPARRRRARAPGRSASRRTWRRSCRRRWSTRARTAATRSTANRPQSIGRCRPSAATSACWCAPTPTSARWAPTGCAQVSENAVLNANYILQRLRGRYDRCRTTGPACTSACSRRDRQKKLGVQRAWTSPSGCSTSGSTPPTIYFPLIVEEALMIEPTETEIEGDARRLLRRDDPDRAGGARPTRTCIHHAPRHDAGAPPRPDQGRARAELRWRAKPGAADVAIQRVDRCPAAAVPLRRHAGWAGADLEDAGLRLYRSAGLAPAAADFDPLFYAADDALVGAVPATLGLDATVHRLFTGISAGLGVADRRPHRGAGRPHSR